MLISSCESSSDSEKGSNNAEYLSANAAKYFLNNLKTLEQALIVELVLCYFYIIVW